MDKDFTFIGNICNTVEIHLFSMNILVTVT
jgi:hypothetical protein